jgi:hypothetical protein
VALFVETYPRPSAAGYAPVHAARSAHTLDSIVAARRMYQEGARVRDISAATGMSIGTPYYHLDGHSLPGVAKQRLPRRREVDGNALKAMPLRERKSGNDDRCDASCRYFYLFETSRRRAIIPHMTRMMMAPTTAPMKPAPSPGPYQPTA